MLRSCGFTTGGHFVTLQQPAINMNIKTKSSIMNEPEAAVEYNKLHNEPWS